MSETLQVERRGPALWAWLSRPEKRNALNRELLGRLTEFVRSVDDDAEVGAVILSGRGSAFSAGGDVVEMDDMSEARFSDTIRTYMQLADRIRSSGRIFIAAVNGHAVAGGLELALMCDLRVAAQSATFRLPDAALGLSPTSGMTWLLPRTVGLGRALHLTLLGEPITADEAERIGLVTAVAHDAELEATAQAWAETIAAHPAVAVRATKRAFQHAATADFAGALEFEHLAERYCFSDPATRARLRAFRERGA